MVDPTDVECGENGEVYSTTDTLYDVSFTVHTNNCYSVLLIISAI